MPVAAVLIGYRSRHPTLANLNPCSSMPPAVPTVKALTGVLPAALHQQAEPVPR